MDLNVEILLLDAYRNIKLENTKFKIKSFWKYNRYLVRQLPKNFLKLSEEQK